MNKNFVLILAILLFWFFVIRNLSKTATTGNGFGGFGNTTGGGGRA